MELPKILEELRYIAQMGLHYNTGDAYDYRRYKRLLHLVSELYSHYSEEKTGDISALFLNELGHITPKVGVDAAIFNAQKEIFLIQRSDDHSWALPSGWCDLNESPREALKREVFEELGLEARIGPVIETFSRMPGDFNQAHTTYHLLFEVTLEPGEPCCAPDEVLDWKWHDLSIPCTWHRDHANFAQKAFETLFEKGAP